LYRCALGIGASLGTAGRPPASPVPHARGRSSAGIAAFGHLLARSAIPADLLALANKVACQPNELIE
jgi:hypothetical protein